MCVLLNDDSALWFNSIVIKEALLFIDQLNIFTEQTQISPRSPIFKMMDSKFSFQLIHPHPRKQAQFESFVENGVIKVKIDFNNAMFGVCLTTTHVRFYDHCSWVFIRYRLITTLFT